MVEVVAAAGEEEEEEEEVEDEDKEEAASLRELPPAAGAPRRGVCSLGIAPGRGPEAWRCYKHKG